MAKGGAICHASAVQLVHITSHHMFIAYVDEHVQKKSSATSQSTQPFNKSDIQSMRQSDNKSVNRSIGTSVVAWWSCCFVEPTVHHITPLTPTNHLLLATHSNLPNAEGDLLTDWIH